MKVFYDPDGARELLALLDSIGREIRERESALAGVESSLQMLSLLPSPQANDVLRLIAEAALHRRELRLAYKELDQLGCNVVGTEPLTFRIPCRVDGERQSLLWQVGVKEAK